MDGAPRIDMGAFEFDHVRLSVTGAATPGGTLQITGTGTPGLGTILFVGTAPGLVNVYPIGPLFFDVAAPWIQVPWAALPHAIPVLLPAAFPVPQPLVLQLVAFNGAGAGNASNAVSVLVQ